jgi:hypothetical protein
MATKKISIEWKTAIKTGNWWASGLSKGARMARARVASEQRTAAWVLTTAAIREHGWRTPVEASQIVIRVRRPRLMDSDGVVTACKYIRDGIARALGGLLPKEHAPDGVNDPYQFSCEQYKGSELVTIEIEIS